MTGSYLQSILFICGKIAYFRATVADPRQTCYGIGFSCIVTNTCFDVDLCVSATVSVKMRQTCIEFLRWVDYLKGDYER
ncbi:hypothetical protein QWZ16_20445 [Vibrio ostreicida]|uniref:Uncharacterized protein n=1 Tax=Vibrio ostreicida TaxID=526588 RepID=A0ABT8C0T5_9VIBR|nr:hypothetical protein [Vibrio ostreicida]MDN3611965.1 hypothetical protein [Vibrio ostreicida]